MAIRRPPDIPLAGSSAADIPLAGDPVAAGATPVHPAGDGALQRPLWRNSARLSSVGDIVEQFLGEAAFDRGPWVAVALAAGIGAWFWLDGSGAWIAAIAGGALLALGGLAMWKGEDRRVHLRQACVTLGLVFGVGVALIWARSELVGAPPLDRPVAGQIDGRVLERIEQPADDRVRLVLATRHPDSGEPVRVRVNLPLEQDAPGIGEGAVLRLNVRLIPPSPPILPGSYNFARTAWFEGYVATGSVTGEVAILEPAQSGSFLAAVQRRLSGHVRGEVGGAAGTIAAAFASGDRGAISEADEIAMRDAGLTHLLSISGLHVSAVIAGAYFLAMKLLALWPWLALRVRLPLAAAGIGALAGIGYTLLTGAEVPTVRSCVGAVLVLGALALGREALSLRMVAIAAIFVLLLWPEALVGPSFQMSFAAVIAIVALHTSGPVRAFLAPREESRGAWLARRTAMLLVTGLVIEIALMPIVLFHFHRAGVYGALANVIAIPLVTFVSMPLIALALFMDLAGLGAPAWWLVEKSLDLLLGIARFTAGQPGAVKLMPQMTDATFALFLAGGLWLGLWRSRARLLGLVPAAVATIMLLTTPVPDILVTGDGRQVGITGEGEQLLVLRESRSSFTGDSLKELAGTEGVPIPLESWPGARCSRDFCVIGLERGGRDWQLLMSHSGTWIEEDVLTEACRQADIVISDRFMPRSCAPRWLKADRRMLRESGGLAINLDDSSWTSVAEGQGEHGWWPPSRD